MIFRWLLLSLSVAALSPGLLRAQQSSNPGGPPGAVDSATPAPSADPKMYEDIEIFRRILDRKLHALYPSETYPSMGGMMNMQGAMMGMQGGMRGTSGMGFSMAGSPMPGGGFNFAGSPMAGMGVMNPVVIPIRSLEGVYLKGQGVVYTATLSSLQPPRPSVKAETPKPVSEWDSVRREVRNEKEKPKEPAASKPLELSDLLLMMLAENGPHFSRLGENESLTIVVTVHEKSSTSSDRKSGGQLAQPHSRPSKVVDQLKAQDMELVGELHMKQGRYDEALAVFHKALERNPSARQAEMLYRKVAQAYLALEKNEEARAALDRAIALRKEIVDAKDKPAAKPAAVALPVKLIVSAPKKLLDQAGEKKISFEEFRRRASVETLTFGERRR